MASFRFTHKAVDDLTRIWKYTMIKWSDKQADNYYKMLIDTCREIASKPDLGKKYTGIMKDLSGFKAGRHIIFYRSNEGHEIEIVRILHEQMDLKNGVDE